MLSLIISEANIFNKQNDIDISLKIACLCVLLCEIYFTIYYYTTYFVTYYQRVVYYSMNSMNTYILMIILLKRIKS